MPAATYATVSDPLSLGTLYVCTDEGGAGGSDVEDMKTIKDTTGGFLQGNARSYIESISPKYNMLVGATVLTAGSTQNGYFIDSCVPSSTNENHKVMDVKAHKRVNADIVDTVFS